MFRLKTQAIEIRGCSEAYMVDAFVEIPFDTGDFEYEYELATSLGKTVGLDGWLLVSPQG